MTKNGGFGLSASPPETEMVPFPNEIVPAARLKTVRRTTRACFTTNMASSSSLRQSLLEIVDNILHCFDAGAQTYQPVVNTHALALLGRDIAMGGDNGI